MGARGASAVLHGELIQRHAVPTNRADRRSSVRAARRGGLIGALIPRQVSNRTPVPYTTRSPNTGWSSGWLSDQSRASQLATVESSSTLYGVIRRLYEATAQVDWNLWREAASGEVDDRTLIPSRQHAAAIVWNRPNPFMTNRLFVEIFQQWIDLVGEAYWVIVKVFGVPVELWPIRPDKMTPDVSALNFRNGWIYKAPDGEEIHLNEDEVVQLRTPHPSDIHRGLSPIRSLMADLDATALSAQYMASFFANSAQPGGVIAYEERLDDAEYKTISQRWAEQHQGVANAGRVAIIEGATWHDVKMTSKDMQWVEARRLSGDLIREAYGFPKFAQGIVDDVNRATADASDAMFARYLSVPRLDRIKDALNVHFLPMFGLATTSGLTFDYVNPVPADREADNAELTARTGAFVQMVGTGLFDPASLLEALNLPSIDLAKVGIDPVTGQPVQPGSVGTDGAAAGDPRALAEIIQKIYLGVNVVVTPQEARQILADAGANIDPSITPEAPDPPAPDEPNAPPGAPPPSGAGATNWLAWSGPRAAREPGPEARRVQRDWTSALNDLMATWRSIVAGWRASALEQVREALAQEQPGLLAGISVPTIEAAVTLSGAMVDLAALSARRVVQEAGSAGVQAAEGVADAELMGRTAAATANLLGNRFANDLATEALRWHGSGRSVSEVMARVESWADNLAEGGVGVHARAQLGGALTRAQNDGRMATFRINPGAKYYASEVLDGNTCKPCASIDGQQIPTLDAAILAYGGGGGYLFCEGGVRCRGYVTASW
jgi:HK97 family phage portal protein